MNHLNDDELLRLAEVTEELLSYDEVELRLMEHLKFCEDCYKKFCTTLALVEVTSESGYMILSDMYGITDTENVVQEINDRALAVIGVFRRQMEDGVRIFLEQIQQTGSAFCFAPVLAAGTRGSAEDESDICKLEDLDDEKTFLFFDSASNEILLQINTKSLEESEIRAFIVSESGEKTEILLEKKGKLRKGVVKNPPKDDFKIEIEELEE